MRNRGTPKRFRTALAVAVCFALVLSLGAPGIASANRVVVWEELDTGVELRLEAVHFVDAETGWAVGNGGGGLADEPSILKTTDGGDTWVVQHSRENPLDFNDVYFLDGNTGWAVGAAESLNVPENVWKTEDGGESWTAYDVDTIRSLNAVHFADDETGWCVAGAGQLWKTTDGGATWEQRVSGVEDLTAHLYDVHFINAETGWAVGWQSLTVGGVIIKTTDGGETWTTQTPPLEFLRAIHFSDGNNGWAVGASGIVATLDGGETWTEQEYEPSLSLYDVHFVDAQRGWAAGNGGLIISTVNGGQTWQVERQVAQSVLYSIHFVDAEHGWAVGNSSLALRYTLGLPPVLEVEGEDRFGTAVDVSKIAFPDGAETVVIATGRNWPDALGGTALAGVLDAPILLVSRDAIPTVTADEIDRLGATSAVILGGTAAVGTPVEAALVANLGAANVTRIGGASRYETADLVAERVKELLGDDYDGTAFVATGANFPDALAAGPLAAANGWPLHLAHPARGISDETAAAMDGVSDVLILGGEGAVSSATQAGLITTYGAGNVTRLAGTTRYDTAVEVATYGVEHAGLAWDRAGIATGQRFPDALAGGVLQGGVLQGKIGSVMLLTRSTSLEPATRAVLAANKDEIETVTFFGGEGALSQAVRDAVAAALE